MKSPQELLRQLEIEVRTPAERLPIDTFLPSPESLPSDFSPAPSMAQAGQARELGGMEGEKSVPPKSPPRGVHPDPSRRSPDTPKSLHEEVHEFMSRHQPARFDQEEDSDLLQGFDPNSLPED